MKVLLLVAVLAVASVAVHARAVPTTSAETELVGGEGRCFGFQEWTHYCLVVEDLTRLVVDVPRTWGIIEDAAIQVAFMIADLIVTPEYIGEAIQAFVAVQLDAVFWVPKFIWGIVESVIDGSHNFVRFIERLTKLHILDQVKVLIVEPVFYIRKVLKSTWTGIKAGLEKSGLQVVVAWVEKLEANFNFYVVQPILKFLDMAGGAMRCTTWLPQSVCHKIFSKFAAIDDMYVSMWKDFWGFVHGPGWGILDFLKTLIKPIINFLDKIPQKLRDFCEKRSACMRFVEVVETIDKFARSEVKKGEEIAMWAVLWIKKHVFEDVKMLAASMDL